MPIFTCTPLLLLGAFCAVSPVYSLINMNFSTLNDQIFDNDMFCLFVPTFVELYFEFVNPVT